jgi:hypothetical protein
MWILGVGLFQKETANFRGGVRQNEQIFGDPNYRTATYNHFFDLCASVQTFNDQITVTRQQMTAATGDSIALRDLTTNLGAQENGRNEAIRQYNADASKTATLDQFRSASLPIHIDPQSESVSCGD